MRPGDSVIPVDLEFSAELWEWRGAGSIYSAPTPPAGCAHRRAEAAATSYGWEPAPVRARIGRTEWETSLLPKDGGYAAARQERGAQGGTGRRGRHGLRGDEASPPVAAVRRTARAWSCRWRPADT